MIVNAISQLGLSLLAAGMKPAPPVNPAVKSRSIHARQMLEPEDEFEEPTADEIAAVVEFLADMDHGDADDTPRSLRRLVATPADAEDAYASN